MKLKDLVPLFSRGRNNIKLMFRCENEFVYTYPGHIKSYKNFYEWDVLQIYGVSEDVCQVIISKEKEVNINE